MTDTPNFLRRPAKADIAYRKLDGKGPGYIWLGGYASDMLGTKAEFVSDWAKQNGRGYLRFDYSGHGEGAGNFEDGCITDWADDALNVLDELTEGPQVLIGSSMGGWVSCLLARQRPERLAGLILIAPAPDFTHELMWPSWDDETREKIMTEGKVEFPSEYDDSVMVYTKKLYEDGASNFIFSESLQLSVPVRILQGMQDDAVPWQHATRLADHIEADDLEMTLVKSSDHRMSSDEDLKKLKKLLEQF